MDLHDSVLSEQILVAPLPKRSARFRQASVELGELLSTERQRFLLGELVEELVALRADSRRCVGALAAAAKAC